MTEYLPGPGKMLGRKNEIKPSGLVCPRCNQPVGVFDDIQSEPPSHVHVPRPACGHHWSWNDEQGDNFDAARHKSVDDSDE